MSRARRERDGDKVAGRPTARRPIATGRLTPEVGDLLAELRLS